MGEQPRGRRWLRQRVAAHAARLMYFEGVKEYLRAKKKAGKQLGVTVFPNNSEVRAEVDRLAAFTEGPARQDRLLRLRLIALEVMELLELHEPRLIGSVLTGLIKSTSDVDLHAFSDDHEEVGDCLLAAGFDVEYDIVKTRKGGCFMDFPHYYVHYPEAAVEISVYPWSDLKRPQKSSITHRTMERATTGAVRRLIAGMREPER